MKRQRYKAYGEEWVKLVYHQGEAYWEGLPPDTVGYRELDDGTTEITVRADLWDRWHEAQ